MDQGTPQISVHNLSVHYGPRVVLSNIRLDIACGENVTIIGPNGAGKTTLLKCLGGLIAPSSGQVRLNGQDLARYRRTELARLVAYVPQSTGQMLPCSVHEFVVMARYAHFRRFAGIWLYW